MATRLLAIILLLVAAPAARADVVINEIFFHAPDDLDNVQFIELHNTGDQPADLAGWQFTRGVKYTFPAGARLAAKGYLVLCKDLAEFRRHYGFDAAGQYSGSLSHGGEHLELADASGRKIDGLKYKTRAPWPVAADGYGASLERLCPTAPADRPDNWAPSPLAAGSPKPGGTPGRQNSTYVPRLPPAVENVTFTPSHAAPGQAVTVQADVRAEGELRAVEICYRVAGSGFEGTKAAVPMSRGADGRWAGTIPGQKAGQILRFRIRAVDARDGERFFPHPNELRPALSLFVHEPFEQAKVPLGLVINVGAAEFQAAQREGGRDYGAAPSPTPPARGRSAFVYVDPKSGTPELFDFINVTPRSAGRKVRLHKDHPLGDMTTINLIYEYVDRFVLAEAIAYEVYRKAGNAACRTDFVRTFIDGRPIGYQLLIEQPNKAFLKHNHLQPDGNMYKCQWFGDGVIGQHEKKTHSHEGHDDLVSLVDQLNRTRGDEQWAVIKKNFDVEQVVNYFAVNMVLSHWDGFFNNYFTYHDVKGTGKWTMYPWDQDKTWGFHDGLRGYDFFVDMPLTFGMAGDAPPGWPQGRPPPNDFGFGPAWWRPGGHFSKPLLANPRFRQLFLARTREILEKVYTEEAFFPLIKAMGDQVEDEVKYRARIRGEDPRQAVEHLRRNLEALRGHLVGRRKFLLAQDEIKNAGKFDRAALQ